MVSETDQAAQQAAQRRAAPAEAATLADVLVAAAEVADQARDLVASVGRVGEREAAMLAGVAEQARDRALSDDFLQEVRAQPILRGLRHSAHRAVDLGFDAAGAGLRLGSEALDSFLRTPRRETDR